MPTERIPGNDALLRLGARMAEIEALYACVLNARDSASEQHLLTELAKAAARLAHTSTGPNTATPRGATRPRTATPRTRTQRRIISTRRTTDWIIAHTGGRPR